MTEAIKVKKVETHEDEIEEKATVETQDNIIYFQGDVTEESCLRLIKELKKQHDTLYINWWKQRFPTTKPILWLQLDTYGGSTYDAFAVVDAIQTLELPVYSLAAAKCFSAGTIIACACSKRFMYPNGLYLVHQPTYFFWGKHDDLEVEVDLMDITMGKLLKLYKERSKLKIKQLKKLLSTERYLTAEDCLEFGFIDEIYKGNPS